jgi:hypothetical protein
MNNYTLLQPTLRLSVILAIFAAIFLIDPKTTHAAPFTDDCVTDSRRGMTGSIKVDYENHLVSVTLNRLDETEQVTRCAYIGAAVYLIPENGMPMAGLNNQVLFDSKDGIIIWPGESKTIELRLPEDNCRVQIDGFVGSTIYQFNYPDGEPKVGWYSSRLVTSMIDDDLPFCKIPKPTPTPTREPTPTPTVEPTPTPTVEPTPSPSTQPTPTPTSQPTPTSEPTPTPTNTPQVLAEVDQLPETGSGFELLGLLAGVGLFAGGAMNEYLKKTAIQ